MHEETPTHAAYTEEGNYTTVGYRTILHYTTLLQEKYVDGFKAAPIEFGEVVQHLVCASQTEHFSYWTNVRNRYTGRALSINGCLLVPS